MKKRFSALFLCFSLVFSLSGCGLKNVIAKTTSTFENYTLTTDECIIQITDWVIVPPDDEDNDSGKELICFYYDVTKLKDASYEKMEGYEMSPSFEWLFHFSVWQDTNDTDLSLLHLASLFSDDDIETNHLELYKGDIAKGYWAYELENTSGTITLKVTVDDTEIGAAEINIAENKSNSERLNSENVEYVHSGYEEFEFGMSQDEVLALTNDNFVLVSQTYNELIFTCTDPTDIMYMDAIENNKTYTISFNFIANRLTYIIREIYNINAGSTSLSLYETVYKRLSNELGSPSFSYNTRDEHDGTITSRNDIFDDVQRSIGITFVVYRDRFVWDYYQQD